MCELINEPKFQINVLPAAHGDCIHLRFYSVDHDPVTEKGKQKTEAEESPEEKALRQEQPRYRWYNIVIDSGPEDHCDGFVDLMESIRSAEERVDLLCFTHIDDDHIYAAQEFLSDDYDAGDLISEIWLNIPEEKTKGVQPMKPSPVSTTSVTTAMGIYSYILGHEIPHKIKVVKGLSRKYGNVSVDVVGPTEERWEKLIKEWNEKEQDKKDSAVKTISKSRKRSDKSPTNGSSIVLAISTESYNLLFAGDAFAVDLKEVAQQLGVKGFDLVKLPHHGSEANITKVMLNNLKCSNFVISTEQIFDDKKQELLRPSQTTVDYLSDYAQREKRNIKLYGNYKWGKVLAKPGVEIKHLEDAVEIGDGLELRSEGYE